MKKGFTGRTDTDQNSEIGIMIQDEMTMTMTAMADAETATTEIGSSATTPRTTTLEGTTDGTRNYRGTRITEVTTEEDIFAKTSVERQPKNTTGDQIQTQPWHHQNNERRKTKTE